MTGSGVGDDEKWSRGWRIVEGDGAMDGIGWRGLVGRRPLRCVRAQPGTKARAVVQGPKQKRLVPKVGFEPTRAFMPNGF